MLKKGGIYKQYKVIRTDGKRAIIKDATFSSNRRYVLSYIQKKQNFINISNLSLPGFPKIIDEFYEKNYEYFVYPELKSAALDQSKIKYDLEYAVSNLKDICDSILKLYTATHGRFLKKITYEDLKILPSGKIILINAYDFFDYIDRSESDIVQELFKILYIMLTGEKEIHSIRENEPAFSYTLDTAIINSHNGKNQDITLDGLSKILMQYQQTDQLLYESDRSKRPSLFQKKQIVEREVPDISKFIFSLYPEIEDYVVTDQKEQRNHQRTKEITGNEQIKEKKPMFTADEFGNLNQDGKAVNDGPNLFFDRNKEKEKAQSEKKVKTNNEEKSIPRKKEDCKSDRQDISSKEIKKSQKEEKTAASKPEKNVHQQKENNDKIQNKLRKGNIKHQENLENKKKQHREKTFDDVESKNIKKNTSEKQRNHQTNDRKIKNNIQRNEGENKKTSLYNGERFNQELDNDVKTKKKKTIELETKEDSRSFSKNNAAFIENSNSTVVKSEKDTIIQMEEKNSHDINFEDSKLENLVIRREESDNRYDQDLVSAYENPDIDSKEAISSRKKEKKFISKKRVKAKLKVKYEWNKKRLIAVAAVFVIIAITGGTLFMKQKKQNDYENYIEIAGRSTDQEEKIETLNKAIDLIPEKIEAYEALLNVYLEDAIFDTNEEKDFLKAIHMNWNKVKKNDDYGKLAFEIGKAYWYYYSFDGKNEEITRMKSATQWFSDAQKGNVTKYKKIAKIYCAIGKFNQDITLNVAEGSDRGVYKQYYENLKSLLKIGNANTVASLELYKLTINSLDIYKQRLIDDGVTEEEITETRENTLYKVNQISAVTQKETELKNSIISE